MLRLPQAKKSSSKSKKASGAKDFRNKGPLRFCLRLTRALSYRQVWANPQAVVYEHLSTVQGPNVQSSNNGGDYTSRRKNEFANRLYPTKQDFNIREGERKCCAFGIDHSLQELDLKLKAQGLSVFIFTAEHKKLERKEKEFFFMIIKRLLY